MTYLNNTPPTIKSNNKIGVLLVNLGTPDDCDVKSVRRYLKQFLSDPRVVEAHPVLWWLFLNVILLNTRPKKTAAAYQSIWSEEGSPLLKISMQQSKALQINLNQKYGENLYCVELGMTYGKPSVSTAMLNLKNAGCTKLIVLPLYPQYSGSTTAATFDAVSHEMKKWRQIPELRMINHYYDHPAYIDALAVSIKQFWTNNKQADKLIMSFHGIPQEYIDNGDAYYFECQQTAKLLAKRLQLNDEQWMLTFQSRLGPKKWLTPYTDLTLKDLAANKNVSSVQIICPGFSADCLETLEEIAIENKHVFISNGGKEYDYIPCLNEHKNHIKMMQQLIHQHSNTWFEKLS